jgi:hypothetical protein
MIIPMIRHTTEGGACMHVCDCFLACASLPVQCSRPPDIDIANDDGVTIAALVDKALGHAPPRGQQQYLAHGTGRIKG